MWYVHVYIGVGTGAMVTTLVAMLRLMYRIGALVSEFKQHVNQEREARTRIESDIRDLRRWRR